MYDSYYNNSDKAKNTDFWEEVTITTTGAKLKQKRSFKCQSHTYRIRTSRPTYQSLQKSVSAKLK